jgi:hypothetical protein
MVLSHQVHEDAEARRRIVHKDRTALALVSRFKVMTLEMPPGARVPALAVEPKLTPSGLTKCCERTVGVVSEGQSIDTVTEFAV